MVASAAAAARVFAVTSRRLWRGLQTTTTPPPAQAPVATASPLLARLLGEPDSVVKATMEEASSTPRCDAAFWEPVAAALRLSSPTKAHLVLEWKLEKLLNEGVRDQEPYSRIIQICGKIRNMPLAMRVFESMEAEGIRPNTGVFNALVTAFLSVRDIINALSLFEIMEGLEDCKPDSVTYSAFISVFSQGGNGHGMMSWYLAAKKAGFAPSIQAYESLITGFVRLDRLDDADRLFEEMKSVEIKPNITILEAKLEVLCRRQDLGEVKEFIKFSNDGGWELSEAMTGKLLRFYLDLGLVDEMENLLHLMRPCMHLTVLARVHSGIIRGYANADRLGDMEYAICRMMENGMMFTCQEDVEAIICSYFRQKEFGRLDLFLDRTRGSYKLARSTYDILVAGYRRFELHERLDLTIKEMKAAAFA